MQYIPRTRQLTERNPAVKSEIAMFPLNEELVTPEVHRLSHPTSTGTTNTVAVLNSQSCHAHQQTRMHINGEQFRAAVTFSLCVHASMGASLRIAPAHGVGLLMPRHSLCGNYAAGEGWPRRRAAPG